MEQDGAVDNINLIKLITTCYSPNSLFPFLRLNNLISDFSGQCDHCCRGTISLVKSTRAADGHIWSCSYRKCTNKISFRRCSFFERSHLSIAVILQLVYYWIYKYPQHIVLQELGVSKKTVVDFYNFCREVCSVVLQKEAEPIGGPGKIVEIDESKFGKRKYNRGRRVDGIWVFGGVERDSGNCFFETVPDRKAETLLPIIKRWIQPGTTIYSDCWKAYDCLVSEGYVHGTVNHSITFVSEYGVHTNNIESRWCAVKRSLPRFGTQKDFYDSYFAEYCIRKKYFGGFVDKFRAFLRLIATVYQRPAADQAPTQQIVPVENIPVAVSSASTTADTTAVKVVQADPVKFNSAPALNVVQADSSVATPTSSVYTLDTGAIAAGNLDFYGTFDLQLDMDLSD